MVQRCLASHGNEVGPGAVNNANSPRLDHEMLVAVVCISLSCGTACIGCGNSLHRCGNSLHAMLTELEAIRSENPIYTPQTSRALR